MALLEVLTNDMKEAMKARAAERLNTIRLLISDLKTERINKMRDLTPEDELDFLSRQAKRRRESIESFDANDRAELADIERSELAVIETYLPKQLSVDEVREIITTTIAELGVTSKKEVNKLMAPLMAKLKGRFPGKDVKPLVESILPE
jgi:uncharacterized protein YqeY